VWSLSGEGGGVCAGRIPRESFCLSIVGFALNDNYRNIAITLIDRGRPILNECKSPDYNNYPFFMHPQSTAVFFMFELDSLPEVSQTLRVLSVAVPAFDYATRDDPALLDSGWKLLFSGFSSCRPWGGTRS
jgi:hypothetical protein